MQQGGVALVTGSLLVLAGDDDFYIAVAQYLDERLWCIGVRDNNINVVDGAEVHQVVGAHFGGVA